MDKRTPRNKALERVARQPLTGPTLFGARSEAGSSANQPVRMLAALDSDVRNGSMRRRSVKRIASLGLLLLCGLALIAFGYGAMQREEPVGAPNSLVERHRPALPEQPEVAVFDQVASPAAVIEDAPRTGEDSPFAALAEAGTKPKPPAVIAAAPTAASPIREKTVPAPGLGAAKAQLRVMQRPAAPRKAKDADVVLLEALVTHVEAQKNVVAENSATRGAAAAEIETSVRVAAGAEDTLKRCAGLAGGEAEL